MNEILKPFFSKYDLSNLSEDDKKQLVGDVTKFVGFICLDLFLALDLKTHIESMLINEATKKEYILSFKTVDKFATDLKESINNNAHSDFKKEYPLGVSKEISVKATSEIDVDRLFKEFVDLELPNATEPFHYQAEAYITLQKFVEFYKENTKT